MINEQAERDPITGQYPGTEIETKEFFRASEFWATALTVLCLMVAALSLSQFDAPGATLMITILVATYTLSRGIAKAGSSHPFWGREMSLGEKLGTRKSADRNDVLERIERRLDQLERSQQTTTRVML